LSNTSNGGERMCSGRIKTSYPTSDVHYGTNVLLKYYNWCMPSTTFLIYNNPDLSKVDNSMFYSFGAEIPITDGCMPCGELKCIWVQVWIKISSQANMDVSGWYPDRSWKAHVSIYI
jgi:hypothetical protein